MPCPELNKEKISKAYKELDAFVCKFVNDDKMNFYEVMVVFAMMDGNIKQQNISKYLIDSVSRFSQLLNAEDQKLR